MSGTAKRSQRKSVSTPVALHQIQQASAGTGKTFALSNRFLRLLALGAPPESILAATFTRKGAGEIMDRVIGRLCRAAGEASAARQLGDFLGIDLNQGTARQLLRRMCAGLHRLQIGTIDSFFHRLARVMSLDLGLPLDWDIAEGPSLAPLVRQALAAMLGDQQVVELLQLISPGDADRSIAERALETIGQTYELYRETTPSAWEQELNHPAVRGEEVGNFIERWSDLAIENDKQRNRWLAELEFLSRADWDELVGSTPLANVNDNNYRYYGAMPDNLVEAYRELSGLVARAVRHELGQRTSAVGVLAARYARELHPRQVQQGVLGFDDITYLLNGVANVLDELAQTRLDTRIEHVLLDEFQDTSPSQWRVLAPLIERVTAAGSRGSFYCVGDKKQAIYAWRGGVAEIFDAVENRLKGRLEPCEPLVASRRSAQPIIDTVNRVFTSLSAVNEPNDSPKRAILDLVQASFPHHSTALTEVPGYVALERVEAVKGDPELTQQEAGKIAVLQRVVEEVCRIHASIPTATVGVLLRNNAHIAWLVHQLQLKQIPASEEGGNPLTDSAAVEHVLSALQLLDHPQDGPARFHLSHGPLATVFGLSPESELTATENRQRAHVAAAQGRYQLATDGLAKTIEQWARLLAPSCSPRDLLRLQQLIELAESHRDANDARPGQFARVVREAPVAEPSSAQIRVMTIHGAKGLEFDFVLAPMLDQTNGWSPTHPPFVSHRPAPDQPIDRVCRWVNEAKRTYLPASVQAMFEEAQQLQVRDALCVLYVLLTRAARELRIFVPEKSNSKQSSPTGVVLATLAAEKDNNGMLYECGQPDWFHRFPVGKHVESLLPDIEQFYLPTQCPDFGGPSPSGQVSSAGTPATVFEAASASTAWHRIPRFATYLQRRGKQSLGSLVHACLARIEWLDDASWKLIGGGQSRNGSHALVPWVVDVADQERLSESQRRELNLAVLAVLSQPESRRIFDRAAYLEWTVSRLSTLPPTFTDALSVSVANERRLAGRIRQGQITEGVIDRWITISEGHRPVAAHVIDFKTDDLPSSKVARQAEKYSRQVAAYRQLVAEFSRLDSESILGDLYFTYSGLFISCGAT